MGAAMARTKTPRRQTGANRGAGRIGKMVKSYHVPEITFKAFRLYADRGGFLYREPLREVAA